MSLESTIQSKNTHCVCTIPFLCLVTHLSVWVYLPTYILCIYVCVLYNNINMNRLTETYKTFTCIHNIHTGRESAYTWTSLFSLGLFWKKKNSLHLKSLLGARIKLLNTFIYSYFLPFFFIKKYIYLCQDFRITSRARWKEIGNKGE